ncbi:MAG: radical SAM protein [Candidatus Hodarchaeales archaeon]|jgi:pyruvate formate-lyase activating enzyme-like uncharacterized protein
MSKKPEKTNWGSEYSGSLSRGCQHCIAGEKMVVLVDTTCTSNCFYCPLSIERKQANTSFANERPFTKISDLLFESKNMSALGASMTGGDPLEFQSYKKTFNYCKTLKEHFSNNFHIHLYTRGKGLREQELKALIPYLDEIRFHIINIEKDFNAVKIALKFELDVGIEIPVIPSRGINYYKKIITTFEALIPPKNQFYFINLNELEISETNYRKLLNHGLKEDPVNLSAVEGSSSLAVEIVSWANKHSAIPVHFCSLKTKDGIQLPNRLLRIALNNKLPSDVVIETGSDKGLLIRGIIESVDYDLDEIKEFLVLELDVPAEMVYHEKSGKRILTNAAILEELKKDLINAFPGIKLGIAEEYPTYDNLQTTYFSLNTKKPV